MKFEPTDIPGAYLIALEPITDNRGYFCRTVDEEEFAMHGLRLVYSQCSISYNKKKGTIRGMHWQECPAEEEKLVVPVYGQIYDVLIDLRKDSPMYGQWRYFHLWDKALYVPRGVAHGFQTLQDDTTVYYHINTPFSKEHSRGIRYNDPAFGIRWPLPVSEISEKDRTYPDWAP